MLQLATEKDRKRILEYCMLEPSINLFIIGDILNFGFQQEFQEIWCVKPDEVGRDEELKGIALRYHENLLLYSQEGEMAELLMRETMGLLEKRKIQFISGKSIIIDRIHSVLGDGFEKREMLFCERDLAIPLVQRESEGTDIRVERATMEDIPEIVEAYGYITEFSSLYSAGTDVLANQIRNRISSGEGIHMIVRMDGRIVCHGNTAGETENRGMIGGILTLPEYRGRGLASRIIIALCKDLAGRGKGACLFFDNPDAGNIYYRLGFKDAGIWTILKKK